MFLSNASGLTLSPTITLTFSEPALCATLQATDFTVTYNGTAVPTASLTCTGTSNTSAALVMSTATAPGQLVVVTSPAGQFTDAQATPNLANTRSFTAP